MGNFEVGRSDLQVKVCVVYITLINLSVFFDHMLISSFPSTVEVSASCRSQFFNITTSDFSPFSLTFEFSSNRNFGWRVTTLGRKLGNVGYDLWLLSTMDGVSIAVVNFPLDFSQYVKFGSRIVRVRFSKVLHLATLEQ